MVTFRALADFLDCTKADKDKGKFFHKLIKYNTLNRKQNQFAWNIKSETGNEFSSRRNQGM